MRFGKRAAALLLSTAVLASMFVTPAFAASRKKIKTVALTVEATIEPDTRFGAEEIEVEVRSEHCSFDTYDILNEGSGWNEKDVPKLRIYLHADDGYYFALTKSSAVKLKGATYIRASKADSSETLKIEIQLPALSETVGEMGEVTLTQAGQAYWEPVRGAGSYEVRLYRDGTGVGVTMLTTSEPKYDCTKMMTKAANYVLKVRPVNGENPKVKGDWMESDDINISTAQAEAIRNGTAGTAYVSGEWKEEGGSWRYLHNDGSYAQNGWELIDGEWYYFNEESIMQTGWIDWNGEWYYCGTSGAMLKNTTTPDGFLLDHEGKIRTD